MIPNRQTQHEIGRLVETALLSGYAITPKWNLQRLYGKTKLTSTIVDDLCARALEHDTVEEPSELLIFAFRARDESRSVLLVRADRLLNEYEYEDDGDEDVENDTDN